MCVIVKVIIIMLLDVWNFFFWGGGLETSVELEFESGNISQTPTNL